MGTWLTLAVKPLLGLALLAGDPDLEWSTGNPGSPAPEAAVGAPAPSMAPAVAAEPTPVVTQSLTREPLDKNFRLSLGVDFGISPSSYGAMGLSVELDWYVFRYLRLHGTLGSAWLPGRSQSSYDPYGSSTGFISHGAFRMLAGFDGVLPFTWGELFAGLSTGTVYTSATNYNYSYFQQWDWVPAVRVRSGVDFTVFRPVVLGLDLAFAQFARSYAEVSWVELRGRVGFAF